MVFGVILDTKLRCDLIGLPPIAMFGVCFRY